MAWKIKRMLHKMLPFLLVVAVAFGGYHLYKTRFFKKNFGPQANKIASYIPFFGSRYRSSKSKHYSRNYGYSRSGKKSYRKSKGHRSRGKAYSRSKKKSRHIGKRGRSYRKRR